MGDEEGERPQDWKIRQYYEQDELADKFLELAEYREIAPTYPNGYGKRPDAINFRGDFEDLVKNGAVAFHASVERWRNPLLIDNVSNLDDLRTTWDLVMDIDCDYSFELAKETAELLIEELRQHGIDNISIKFSGNRGFHIGVRGEAFPQNINDEGFKDLYPDLARGIVDYLREQLKEQMIEKVEEYGYRGEMETDEGLDPYQVSDIENDWGQRHLFRMPYSLHDGSWLVSLPIRPEEIEGFEKEQARMENVDFEVDFLKTFEEGEAKNLAIQAMDFIQERRKKKQEERFSEDREFSRPEDAIPEKYFPPTIKNILEGLEDGRKRGLFILINFYRTVGYSWEEIESKIWQWNERNKEELREAYVKGQLNWHRDRDEDVPPPNYDANGYYRDMQVYEGDNLEEQVPNPVSYAFRQAKKRNSDSGEGEDDGEDLVCPYCGKEYEMESYYKKHVRQCDGDGEVRKIS
ncbi:MAG: DNA primase small subunit domain-containing protein [Candidatus Nanohalobium sp.]